MLVIAEQSAWIACAEEWKRDKDSQQDYKIAIGRRSRARPTSRDIAPAPRFAGTGTRLTRWISVSNLRSVDHLRISGDSVPGTV